MLRNFTLSLLKGSTRIFVELLHRFHYGRKILYQINQAIHSNWLSITHDNIEMKFFVPNRMNYFRAITFSTKEPETLEWINSFEKNSIFWDIGANIGLYSIYSAKKKNCSVFSFEPSVFNLELLARNINLNHLSKLISIIPIPLDKSNSLSEMQFSSTDLGGALSSFNHKIGHDGKNFKSIFQYSIIGLSMDEISELSVPSPDYVKIDVDGIEHFILEGGEKILKSCKSILIEINDDFKEQSITCNQILTDLKFKLLKKEHGERYDNNNSISKNTYNQIWVNNAINN